MNRTAIVYIAERCNQDCVFCLEVDAGWDELPEFSETRVVDLLATLRARGTEHITFMGGETLFRKDLGDIVEEAKKQGFNRVGVTTNGTVASKKGFLKNVVDRGLDFIEFSLHGHTPELANHIGGTNFTFTRQAAALAEIDEIGTLFVIVNVVICRENKDHLLDIAKYVTTNFPNIPLRFKFKFVTRVGRAATLGDEVALSYSEVDTRSVGDYLSERNIPFWFSNFPLCTLGPYAKHSHELGILSSGEKYFDYDHKGGANYLDTGHQLTLKCWPEKCGACTLRPVCAGPERLYIKRHGEDGFVPRSDEPLPLLQFALKERNEDASTAAKRLEELRKEPRWTPDDAPPLPGDLTKAIDKMASLRLQKNGIGVELVATPGTPESKAFMKVGPFDLSYHSGTEKNVYEKPGVKDLLALAKEALRQIAERSSSLAEARDGLAAVAEGLGWTHAGAAPVREEEPEPLLPVVPVPAAEALVPLRLGRVTPRNPPAVTPSALA